MITQEKIDEIAILWNKTKDPKYKRKWYKLVKAYVNGVRYNNIKRRPVQSLPGQGGARKHDGLF
jgi:hypothetical protein